MEGWMQTPLLHHSINEEAFCGVDDAIQESLAQLVLAAALSPPEGGDGDGESENEIEELEENSGQWLHAPTVVQEEFYSEVPAAGHGDGIVQEQSVQRVVRRLQSRHGQQEISSRLQPVSQLNGGCVWIQEHAFSLSLLVSLLWLFACVTMAWGMYGTDKLRIGQGCSILVQPYRFFVQSIDVELSSDTNAGPILYSFHKKPPLDVLSTWSDTHFASLQANTQKDWVYFLNEGSQINISYSIPSSSLLVLTITRGTAGYNKWFYGSSHAIANVVHGNGLIQLNISIPGGYYIAVGNLNMEVAEVQLNISGRALLYNTTDAYYMCMLAQGQCSIPLSFLEEDTAVLTSPRVKQGTSDGEWLVSLSFGPRWTVCLGGAGATTALLLAIRFITQYGCICQRRPRPGYARAPLLPYKDDGPLRLGSSNDSVPEDSIDSEDALTSQDQNGESSDNLCVICFDAPRECFFLPCGHSVACFSCGTRIAEESGTCPICRGIMKKVKKLFLI